MKFNLLRDHFVSIQEINRFIANPRSAQWPARRRSAGLVCLFFVLSSLLALSSAAKDTSRQTILIMGDSLSAAYGIPQESSWVNLMADELSTTHPQVTIVNASISGETTGGGRVRLPGLLKRHNPSVVVLELGGNDGLRGFPVRIIRANLQAMIEMSMAAGSEVLLLGMRIPPNYGAAYTEQFFATYGDLAEQFDLALVPFLLEGIALTEGFMQRDGIHPTAKAQPAITKTVLEKLNPMLSSKNSESLTIDQVTTD